LIEQENTFAKLVDASRSDLRSPHRSTALLLAAWRDFEGAFDKLGNLLGETLDRPATYCFERTERVRGGKRKASCTDLMISIPRRALAIEVKYREPTYATVGGLAERWQAG
jgi:hypothetical protein